MRPQDFIVQVRDKTLTRVGTITPKYLNLKATVRYNGVGDWTLTLPKLHPMVEELSTRGSGIIVSVRGTTVFSGPTTSPSVKIDRDNPDGTYTFTGITDDIVLDGALAYPDPTIGAADGQTTATNDTQTGTGEDLIRHYVGANIVPGVAPTERIAGLRQYLTLDGASLGRGATLTKSPRYTKLSELCAEIATYCGLRFHVIQEGPALVLKISETTDRSDLVRFDIRNGTLTSESASVSAPTVTRAIVAGGGQGTDRIVIERVTSDSQAAEADWGLVIEEFIDQRQTTDLSELQSAGDKELIDNGTTNTAVKAVPADDTTMLYGADWSEGDLVGVIILGQLTMTTVSAVAFIVNKDNTLVGAAIGDVSGFDAKSALTTRVDDTEKRVSNLERNAEVAKTSPVDWGDIQNKPTEFPTTWADIADPPATFPSDWATLGNKPTSYPTTWNDVSGRPLCVADSASARDSYWGTPTTAADQEALQALGAQTIRTDTGWTEQYFAAVSSSNPGGTVSAGWYPIFGKLPSVRYKRVASGSIGTAMGPFNFDTLAAGALVGLTYSGGTFTCELPGEWGVSAAINVGTASSSFGTAIRKNGVSEYGGSRVIVTNSYQSLQASGSLFLQAGDTFDFATFAGQTIGVIMSNGGIPTTFINVRYLGPA